jgi:hypothetical protein
VSRLIREEFLRGISTRQVGRVVATITGETVSAQTVSKLTRDLDEAVRQFHQARLSDDYAYLFLDGVSLRVRRPAGRKRVQMLVAYGVRRAGTRHLLAFLRSQGESQADWEGLLPDLYRRGLEGKHLDLIVTESCPGLAAALPTVNPRVRHQRCRVHKMRNILEKVRKRDYDGFTASHNGLSVAAGGGIEWPVANRWAVRVSVDYVLGRHNVTIPGVTDTTVTLNSVRAAAGIVYTFGGGTPSPKRRASTPRSTLSPVAVTIPQLGIQVENSDQGPNVISVDAGSAGDNAGLRSTDVIKEIDGAPVRSAQDLAASLTGKASGTEVKLKYLRRYWESETIATVQ